MRLDGLSEQGGLKNTTLVLGGEPCIGLMVKKMTDPRTIWQESETLADEMRSELANWGLAYRGGMPPLGYPSSVNFYTPPRDRRDLPPPRSEPDYSRAEAVENALRAIAERRKDANSREAKMLSDVLAVAVLRYVKCYPNSVIAKALRVSNRHVRRLKTELYYRVWVEIKSA